MPRLSLGLLKGHSAIMLRLTCPCPCYVGLRIQPRSPEGYPPPPTQVRPRLRDTAISPLGYEA